MSRSHRRARRAGAVVTTVLVVAATGAAMGARAGGASVGAGSGQASTGPHPATPVLSVRRLPQWIEAVAADRRLARSLPAVWARLGAAAASSCLVVERAGRTVVAYHPALPVVPASNTKLLTATAVLDRLGPGTRIVTRVVAAAAPLGGVVHGDLVLVGAGDPTLRTPAYQAAVGALEPVGTPLASLAASLRASGIRRVDGSVVGDDSLFDADRGVPGWSPDYQAEGDAGALSALEVDDGYASTPPYGDQSDPPRAAAADLEQELRADGVTVTGPPGVGRAPAGGPTLASVRSAPLARIVEQVLTASDDTGAEVLTKLLGARVGGSGTTAAGVAAIRADLAADGLPVRGIRQYDGSGLDAADRVTCGALVALLVHDGTSGPVFAGLPVAAETGTLRDRMAGTPAAGRLHAKTGTLDDVAALSGFVLPPPGPAAEVAVADRPVVFSFVADGLPNASGVEVADALGAALASPHPPPPLADAEPLTVVAG